MSEASGASSTGALILAAGAATRFGGDKVFAALRGRPLVGHVIEAARAAGLEPIVVVLGPVSPAEAGAGPERLFEGVRVVRNPRPADGLSSSVRIGLRALGPNATGAVILLGDQPLVGDGVIAALLAATTEPGRDIVVPRYAAGGGQNPVLVWRSAWVLADELTGDRGFGPVIAAHPERVTEVEVHGTNPDVDTPADLALVAWAAQVRANREQVERFREVGDGDFYASTTSLFRADPRRPDGDDGPLAVLRGLARPGDAWLDIGAGAGRYALPLALAVGLAGEVIAVEVSPGMIGALRADMTEYGIPNVRIVEGRWPLADGILPVAAADVALIAHVGYDVEAIGPFIDAMEAAARRLCVAVLMERPPTAVAEPFWPPVHGEPRVPLAGFPAFVEVLRARGRSPDVRVVERGPRSFPDRDGALSFIRRQTWVAPDGSKDRVLQAELDARLIELTDGSVTLRGAPDLAVGVVTWKPR